ncbi:MAG: GntR family transcriptional regulator [Aliishimia sp.]
MADEKRLGFQDIQDEVLSRIQSRIWPAGTLLPTEIELAKQFGCARATVNRALRELAEQGLIDRKRKRGTIVNAAPVRQAKFEIEVVRQTIEDMNAQYRYSLVGQDLIGAPEWLRAQLNLPNGSDVLHLMCMHYADNQPFQYEERWINIDAVPSVKDADFSEIGPNEWLLAQVPFSNAEIAFSAITADAKLSEFLGTSQGASLFRLERATWLQGRPVTFVRMTYQPGYKVSTRY